MQANILGAIDVTGIVLVAVLVAAAIGADRLSKRYTRLQDRYERATTRLAFYRSEAVGHIEEGANAAFYEALLIEVAYQHAVECHEAFDAAMQTPWWRRWFVARRAARRYLEARHALDTGYAPPGLVTKYLEPVNLHWDDEAIPAWRARLGRDEPAEPDA
jgi:hypothetical protein